MSSLHVAGLLILSFLAAFRFVPRPGSYEAANGTQTPQPSKSTIVMPQTPLLPDRFGEWQVSGPANDAIPLKDDVAKELTVSRRDAKTYTAEGNAASVTAVEFADATGAYSAFTLLRTPGMRPCATNNNLGNDCVVTAGKLLFWSGDTVVSIAPAGLKPVGAGSFVALVRTLPKPMGAKGALPVLPTRLPREGLQQESLRYAVGPVTYAAGGGQIPASVIDFSKSPEILTAHYSGRSGHGVLTTIFYPTPAIAGDRMRAIQTAVAEQAVPAVFREGEPDAARSGPIVSVASSGFTAREAKALVNSIHYEAAITWNKPEGYMDQFKVSNAASVLVQIIIFVIVMCAAALILGVVLGGGRAALRRARGKPISSIDDMEIISLDLRGRPKHGLR